MSSKLQILRSRLWGGLDREGIMDKQGACIIDVGINRIASKDGKVIIGDVDFDACQQIAARLRLCRRSWANDNRLSSGQYPHCLLPDSRAGDLKGLLPASGVAAVDLAASKASAGGNLICCQFIRI